MPFTFNGIGTTLYGAREFLPNGSYITTEWLVFAYVPVVPVGSMRILPASSSSKSYFIYSSSRYSILERTKINFRQVFSVYAWFALVIGSFWTAAGFDLWWLAIPGVLSLGAPWVLRRRAVNGMLKDYERERAGLSATVTS